MKSHPLPRLAAALAACLLCSCAYVDINRGVYEGMRSREGTAAPGSGKRSTLPPYDQYERERTGQRASPPAGSEPAASAAKP